MPPQPCVPRVSTAPRQRLSARHALRASTAPPRGSRHRSAVARVLRGGTEQHLAPPRRRVTARAPRGTPAVRGPYRRRPSCAPRAHMQSKAVRCAPTAAQGGSGPPPVQPPRRAQASARWVSEQIVVIAFIGRLSFAVGLWPSPRMPCSSCRLASSAPRGLPHPLFSCAPRGMRAQRVRPTEPRTPASPGRSPLTAQGRAARALRGVTAQSHPWSRRCAQARVHRGGTALRGPPTPPRLCALQGSTAGWVLGRRSHVPPGFMAAPRD
jgi:hypothetical protein